MFFRRLSNSWELVKASFAVLRADKELVVFPIVATLGTLAVIVSFAIPMAVVGSFGRMADGNTGILEYALAFVFYMVMSFVVIFANTALVGAAMIRLRGGDPTLADGFQIASERWRQIAGYAAISATVGIILRFLRERGGLAGQIVSFLGDIAWGLATYLVVPVLVVENIGPIDAVKRSASLLRQTWGEQIVGNFSIGLIFGLFTVGAVILVGLPVVGIAVATGSVFVIVLAIIAVVLLVAAINLLGSTLNGIYVAAVYAYATEGAINETYFERDLIENAFTHKPKRGI